MSSPHVLLALCYPLNLVHEKEVSTPTSAVVREGCVEKEAGSRWEFWSEASQELLQKRIKRNSGAMPTWPKAGKSLSQ